MPDKLPIASVVGSAHPPFYRFTLPSFCGTLGTWLGPTRLDCAGRKKDDCKPRSDDFVEMNCNDGTGFLSTAFGIGRRPSLGKRASDLTSSVEKN